MNIEVYTNYCQSLKGVTESFPFDAKTLVFKVCGKMFALCDVEDFDGVNLKCDPEKAIELREQFEGINPGYHMNKKHWNTVSTNADVSDSMVFELTKDSYDLVFSSLPKKVRENL
ncbi:MAG: MmcQ/YjbR family DNA-binding protein [Bacteroidota bacterium]